MPPKIYASKVEDVGKPISSTGEKKPRTEKQLAATEKARLARLAKTAEKKVAEQVPETPKETVEPPAPVDEKIKKPRKRTKKAMEAPSEESAPSETLTTLIDEALSEKEKPAKKQKVKKQEMSPPPSVEMKDESEPPKWFKSFIMGIKEEQARCTEKKVSKKQVKFEADTEASEKWREPVMRDRVNKSVDSHMASMYSTIFPNRRF